MPFFTIEKIAKQLPEIRDAIARERLEIPYFKFHEGECPEASRVDFDDRDWPEFRVGDTWGGYDVTAWFRARVQVPESFRAGKLALRFLVGPRDGGDSTAESLLYVNGSPLQGIDVWHTEAWLPPECLQGDELLVALKAWSGVLGVPDRRRFKLAELVSIDEAADRLFHLAGTLLKSAEVLDEDDLRRVRLLQALDQAILQIDFGRPRSPSFYESIGCAEAYLRREVERLHAVVELKPTVVGIGHAHIDMAWLWRLGHSREKAARTFATALHLMRQYPEYRFMHSSPQLYRFIKQDYPELFERIKMRVASGEWEITGAAWVEPDTNLTGGESLVRQLLHGKRFIRDEFGQETTLLWLPDVFGYSAALPQILLRSGIRFFTSTKLSWNQFNRFPHDTFTWRGIDGSEILSHFVTTPNDPAVDGSLNWRTTYNGQFEPYEVKRIWDHYRQKEANDELLLPFGNGDGGGGPTREMLESARAMKNLPGLPRVEQGRAEDYFARLEERLAGQRLPVWDGELYLEYHRGTYTSQAHTKRANRKAEVLYHDAEWLSALAGVLDGNFEYPLGELRAGWEKILLNQFHDILPGSSIRQVYEDSREDYEAIQDIGLGALEKAGQTLVEKMALADDSLVVFNSLPWRRDELIELPWPKEMERRTIRGADGEPVPLQAVEDDGSPGVLFEATGLPPLGYHAFPLVRAGEAEQVSEMTVSPSLLENRHYRIALNSQGQIVSLLDKRHGREVLAPGARGNVFQAFQDKPMAFDAWDIDIYYQEKMREVCELIEAEVEETGPLRGVLRLRWRYGQSTLTQRVCLYRGSPRIDFKTEVDWHERQTLLKVAFPVDVRATRATYDIQFGSLERPTHWNTSWDVARFESVAHKWVDLSEGNYGVSLLNDCKYGHDVKDNVLRLTLIKSPIRPDPEADQGRHEFTYSLLPHAGDWRQARVVEEAYALNFPAHSRLAPAHPRATLPGRFRFAEIDSDHVVLETVKRAEDDDAWIVRCYENKQCRSSSVELRFGRTIRRAVECNLMEEEEAKAAYRAGALSFAIRPFEIKTFKVWFEQSRTP